MIEEKLIKVQQTQMALWDLELSIMADVLEDTGHPKTAKRIRAMIKEFRAHAPGVKNET